MRVRLAVLAVLVAVLALPGAALAQQARNTVLVNYFANANNSKLPDAEVRITNTDDNQSDLCALIYVFRPDQKLEECCGCLLTPHALVTLSVNNDLTANPVSSQSLTDGSIVIVSALGVTFNESVPGCDPANVLDVLTTDDGLSAWADHIKSNGSITETPFDASGDGLSAEVMALACADVRQAGGKAGVCRCPSETPEPSPLPMAFGPRLP